MLRYRTPSKSLFVVLDVNSFFFFFISYFFHYHFSFSFPLLLSLCWFFDLPSSPTYSSSFKAYDARLRPRSLISSLSSRLRRIFGYTCYSLTPLFVSFFRSRRHLWSSYRLVSSLPLTSSYIHRALYSTLLCVLLLFV